MKSKKPKYVAVATDVETIHYYGRGDTEDEAFNVFMSNGDFGDHCEYQEIPKGTEIPIYIYTTIDIGDSDWPEEDVDPEWVWCLDEKIETRNVKYL